MGRLKFILGATLLWLMPARAEAAWLRAESTNFIVYSEGPPERLRERVAQLEDYDALLRRFTGTTQPPSPNKLTIYVVSGDGDLRTVSNVGVGVDGFYAASGEGIAAIVNGRTTGGDRNAVLFHEYTHHFMMQYFPTVYPAWYIEGFAEYFMTARLTPRVVEVGNFSPGRAAFLTGFPWLPTEMVLTQPPHGLPPLLGNAYYAQAWLITHYFFSNNQRREWLRNYLNGVGHGDAKTALQTATGMNTEQFAQALHDYIRTRRIHFLRIQREPPPAPAIAITAMPASADALMLYAAALHIGISAEEAPNALRRIRAAAARLPDDPFARRILAEAELMHGDRAVAARLLEALVAQAPNDAELLYLTGRLHLANAEKSEHWEEEARAARTWFTRAHNLDPNHFQTLYRYAQSQSRDSGDVSENTANVMLLAQQLAPQVTELRMNAADMLIRRREVDRAEAMLGPLMNDPHQSGLAAAARQLVASARGESRPATGQAATPASTPTSPPTTSPSVPQPSPGKH